MSNQEHNHDHECGCGCGEHEEEIIYLTTEDGEEMACEVLGIFEVEGNEYIALLPENTEEAFVYGFNEVDEEIELTRIEDEAEYQKISAVFMELWEAAEEEDEEA